MVVIFEDKSGYFKADGYLGQVVSELLMCHYHKYLENENPPEHVFLLRCFQHNVSAFSMNVRGEVLRNLCESDQLLGGKLVLQSDTKDPVTNKGYNLLDKNQRKRFILLVETIKRKCTQK